MKMKECKACKKYTFDDKCPKCGKPTSDPSPPSYSPEDKYGRYRREQRLKDSK